MAPSRLPSGKNFLQRMQAMRKEEGFSLIELIVTVAIIAILIAVAIPLYGALQRAALEREGGEGATPAPTREAPLPSQAPAEVVTPPDLTVLWVILGVVGALAVVGILVSLFVMLVKRSHNSSLELKRAREEREADRLKALAIWQKSTDRHQWLKDKVLEVETDWDLLFQYPTLTDSTVPATEAFHRALRAADGASADAPADINLAMDISALPYPRLVTTADEAWLTAWAFAKRTGTKLIPAAERKKINQIVKLLKLARDGGGSEHERAVAYKRAEKLVSELQWVKVPERALQAIGAESRLMLEATPA